MRDASCNKQVEEGGTAYRGAAGLRTALAGAVAPGQRPSTSTLLGGHGSDPDARLPQIA